MATDVDFMTYVAAQMEGAGIITYRKMFGEYAIYCGGKVVALVCDNQLFVKPTDRGRAFIGHPTEAPPYPGAKMSFLIDEGLDDRTWLGELIRLTEQALPTPKAKPKKTTAAKAAKKGARDSGPTAERHDSPQAAKRAAKKAGKRRKSERASGP